MLATPGKLTACVAFLALAVPPACADVGVELVAKVTAEDGEPDDSFGEFLSMSDDVLLASSYCDGKQTGSAYLFQTATGTAVKKLLVKDAAQGDCFGFSVSVCEKHAIVGAVGDKQHGNESGAAYLFQMPGGGLTKKLLPNGLGERDNFGYSVACDGRHAIVGAPGDSKRGPNAGAAYLFDCVGGKELGRLLPSDVTPGAVFGSSVAISGPTALIGAPGSTANGIRSGAAYLFDWGTGNEIAKLHPDDGRNGDRFGHSVAISDEVAVIGSPRSRGCEVGSGAAYLFSAKTGRMRVKLRPEDCEARSRFGRSVGISGSLVVVGAPANSTNGECSGAAYVFNTSGEQIAKILPTDGAERDWFGSAVAIRGDRILIGSRWDDDRGNDSGSAYLYHVTRN